MWIVLLWVLVLAAIVGLIAWMVKTNPTTAEIRLGLLTLLPLLGLALFYGFVLRAYIELGTWPAPYNPDPKDLEFNLHHIAIWLSFPTVFVSLAMFGLLTLLTWRQKGDGSHTLLTVAYLAAFAGWFLIFRLDPGNYLVWFMD